MSIFSKYKIEQGDVQGLVVSWKTVSVILRGKPRYDLVIDA